jgi:hypothetical protein
MITTSKFIISGCSSRCAFCNRPFCSRDGYVEFWRASNGEHFCSEFCADDAEEARFRVQHAVFSVPTATTHSSATGSALHPQAGSFFGPTSDTIAFLAVT